MITSIITIKIKKIEITSNITTIMKRENTSIIKKIFITIIIKTFMMLSMTIIITINIMKISITIIIITIMKSVITSIITTIMKSMSTIITMESAVVDADITIMIMKVIIMQMKFSQAGVKRQFILIQRMRSVQF